MDENGRQVIEHNIYQRLNKVMEECQSIPKNGHNNFSNYDYVRAVDVIGHIQKLLVKHGISVSVSEEELIRDSYKNEKDKTNYFSKLKCKAIFRNIDNPSDFHEVIYYSIAADTLDKDIFKAKTGGLKYLFSQQFLLVTNDFIDPEDDSKDPKDDVKGSPKANEGQKETLKHSGGEDFKPEHFVFNFGKFKGKNITTIPEKDLASYADWLETSTKSNGKTKEENATPMMVVGTINKYLDSVGYDGK